jgi:hypothetical protein
MATDRRGGAERRSRALRQFDVTRLEHEQLREQIVEILSILRGLEDNLCAHAERISSIEELVCEREPREAAVDTRRTSAAR